MSTIVPPRAVVTSHTASSTAVISSDSQLPLFHPFGPSTSGLTTIHTLPSLPASLTTPIIPTAEQSIPSPPPAGLVVCTIDFPPRYITPTHRTITCDYMIVMKGEIVLRVDEGKETISKEGDICVQRGCLGIITGGEKIVTADSHALEQSFTAPKPRSG
ncbi:cupin 2 domain-containing protein [Sclerotinia borealis F-4128]|uniref:Cupin 2 domain-containing protein n=1 Tax=Sclerotinia borealis (strain F-4128) TaxID=1432307 RepID=W9CEZ4_SCLBF|nr:cupin 2 domain-containing protein [Sclerotinia borealis F-4128]